MSKPNSWHQVLASIITVAGGLLLVWWQTNKSSEETKDLLQDFSLAVQNSAELRDAVLRPLEGRWVYELKWDKYFTQETGNESSEKLFVSEGTADIRWDGLSYNILLGYENRDDNTGEIYSVGVSIGTLKTDMDGIPKEGDAMFMRYAHRLGSRGIQDGDQVTDYSNVPEKTYNYEIKHVEQSEDCEVLSMKAQFKVSLSEGTAIFTKIR